MKLMFRAAHAGDVRSIAKLIDATYASQVKKLYGDGRRRQWARYDSDRVSDYLDREGEGVRVGEWRGHVLTVCVCRSFGGFGWFHSLAVHIDHQRRGLGKQAVEDAQAYLRGQGVVSIGLMTWPDAIANIEFYQSLHYQPAGLSYFSYRRSQSSLVAGGSLVGESPLQAVLFSSLDSAGRDSALLAVTDLSGEISSGLDYASWLAWTQQRGVGDTLLLWQDGRLLAAALCHLSDRSEWMEGKLLLISPRAQSLDIIWTLEHVRVWAEACGRSSFGFPVDILDQSFMALLRRYKFRLFGDSMLNMIQGEAWPPTGIHLVRFGG